MVPPVLMVLAGVVVAVPLSAVLERAMRQSGTTQKALCHDLGKSQSLVSRILSGEKRCDLGALWQHTSPAFRAALGEAMADLSGAEPRLTRRTLRKELVLFARLMVGRPHACRMFNTDSKGARVCA